MKEIKIDLGIPRRCWAFLQKKLTFFVKDNDGWLKNLKMAQNEKIEQYFDLF